MASTTLLIPQDGGEAEKGGIVNDFMYGSNVAASHIYIRMGFLRKVYGLLFVQILVTTVIAAGFSQSPVLNQTIRENPWILMLCLPLALGLLIALHVKRHHVPINFMLLAGFTVVEAVTVGVAVSMYEAAAVVKAFIMTLVITGGLTAYTFQTKRDFTNIGSGLLVGLMMIIGLGFLNVFMGSNGMELALAGGAALLFCLFIIYDTQMMMKNLSPEEYILATINLYLDMVNLFLELLRIFGDRKG